MKPGQQSPVDLRFQSLSIGDAHFIGGMHPPGWPTDRRATRLGRLFLIACLCLMTACGDVEVATVPSEKEAIEILTLLFDNEIDAHKEEVGEEGAKQWKIIIDGNL